LIEVKTRIPVRCWNQFKSVIPPREPAMYATPLAPTANPSAHRLSLRNLGVSLSAFLAVSFVLCLLGYVLFPGLPITHSALSIFLPGFELLTWSDFLVGLVESVAWGWYIALVFGGLYNFIAARSSPDPQEG
jgi:hypothetical protein